MTDYRKVPRNDARMDTSDIPNQRLGLRCPGPQGSELEFDLYLPAEGKGPFPVLVSVAGGGWYFGSLSSVHLGSCLHTAVKRGYAYVSMACTSSKQKKCPYQIEEVLAVLRYLRSQGAQWGLDPDFIGLWSASSGGHLSLMAALAEGEPSIDCEKSATSARVQAVAAIYPCCRLGAPEEEFRAIGLEPSYDRRGPACADSIFLGKLVEDAPQLCRWASPESYITPAAPPLLLLHGMADTVVPYTASVDFVKKYRSAVGRENVLARFLPGGVHSDRRFKSPETCEKILDFFDRVRAGETPCPEHYLANEISENGQPL